MEYRYLSADAVLDWIDEQTEDESQLSTGELHLLYGLAKRIHNGSFDAVITETEEYKQLKLERDALEDLVAGQEHYQTLHEELNARAARLEAEVVHLLQVNGEVGGELVRAQMELANLGGV